MYKIRFFFILFGGLAAFACQPHQKTKLDQEKAKLSRENIQKVALQPEERAKLAKATFAGGCFWCMEAIFERVKGVKDVISGYSGGKESDADYHKVGAGETDHAETIQIFYDPAVISFKELLEIFFDSIDPTQKDGQGPDIGRQYRSVVFYHDESQKEQTEAYIKELDESGKYSDKIVTQVVPYVAFYSAEDYHQDYYDNHPEVPYIIHVTDPKVKKFIKHFPEKLKKEYQKS